MSFVFVLFGLIHFVNAVHFTSIPSTYSTIQHPDREKWAAKICQWDSLIRKEDIQINRAWLRIKSEVTTNTQYLSQHDQCFGCVLQAKGNLTSEAWDSFLVDSQYGTYMRVTRPYNATYNQTICSGHEFLKERGDYWLIIYTDAAIVGCDLVLNNTPPFEYAPLLYAILIYAVLAILWIILTQLRKKRVIKNPKRKSVELELPENTAGPIERHIPINDVPVQNVSGSVQESTSTDAEAPPSADTEEQANGDVSTNPDVPANDNVTPNGNVTGEQVVESQPKDDVVEKPKRRVVRRLRSLDTFRGLCLAVMIFVNYGGGQYMIFQHAYWDGLLIADLVFPWFVFIMGTSMAFSFRSIKRKKTPLVKVLFKIVKRTFWLFAIGIMLASKSSNYLPTLRIPGVLQRFAVTYLVVALTHLPFSKAKDNKTSGWYYYVSDILDYWVEWIIMFFFLALHIGLTFLLPIPGCPTGYLGPGGFHEGGKYFNCTGGAAGYIDLVILTNDHVFQWPTIRQLYQTNGPFDPEGILGSLTSIFMCFLGLQAGKIIITYKSHNARMARWLVWGIFWGALGLILCQAKQTGGWIPINKNLWSVSFIFALSGMAYILLIFLYVFVDIRRWWSGSPFFYAGMNSIVIYACQSIFSQYFPVSWQMPDPTLKWQRLLMSLWGTTVWCVVAFLLFYNRVFVAL